MECNTDISRIRKQFHVRGKTVDVCVGWQNNQYVKDVCCKYYMEFFANEVLNSTT